MIEITFDDSGLNDFGWTFGQEFHFLYILNVGDISEDIPGPARYAVISRQLPLAGKEDICMEEMEKNLQTILTQSANGEHIRIWYSDWPGDMCGFYWLMEHLSRLGEHCGPVSAIKLPQNALAKDGSVLNTWMAVDHTELPDYLPLEQPVSPALMRACASHWKDLKQENAPLRAVLNGRLVSVPETLYDSFIRQEMLRAGNESQKTIIICNVLNRYQLGIGDQWISERIDKLRNAEPFL